MLRSQTKIKILITILVILAILSIRTINTILHSSLQDYSYYLGAAHNLLSGKNPYLIYPTQVYPPASLLLFIPLSLLPLTLSKIIWTSISLISLFFGIKIFSAHILKKDSYLLTLTIFILSLQTFPVKYALAQGQINFLVFLGFALFFHFLSKKKYHLTGLILSLIVILKFNPIFLIPYLLITKNTKPLLAFIFSFTILNLSIDLFTPYALNNSFLHSITNMSTHFSGYYFNTSLAAVSIRYFSQFQATFFNLILTSIILLITLLVTKKHNPLTFCLFLTTILLTSPITWQHYLFWSIPAFLLLVTRAKSKLNLALILLSFLLINLNLNNPQSLFIQNPLYSHPTIGLLLLYFLLIFSRL